MILGGFGISAPSFLYDGSPISIGLAGTHTAWKGLMLTVLDSTEYSIGTWAASENHRVTCGSKVVTHSSSIEKNSTIFQWTPPQYGSENVSFLRLGFKKKNSV